LKVDQIKEGRVLWNQRKNLEVILGSVSALVLFDIFYLSVVVPPSKIEDLNGFWYFFVLWGAASFLLAIFMGRSNKGVSRLFLIAAVTWIGVGTASESLPGIVGPAGASMLPGWFLGVIVALVVLVFRRNQK
jgi:hypothetical protein